MIFKIQHQVSQLHSAFDNILNWNTIPQSNTYHHRCNLDLEAEKKE